MERISSIALARRPAGSKELALPGTQQLTRDSLIQMGTMLRQMSAAFPHQEYDPETTEVFLMTFEDLAVEFGLAPLEQALRSFLSRQKFFPHPSEVREELEAMAKKKQQEQVKNLPKLGCEECMPNGVGRDGIIIELDTDGERYVRFCECLLARRRARKALEAE